MRLITTLAVLTVALFLGILVPWSSITKKAQPITYRASEHATTTGILKKSTLPPVPVALATTSISLSEETSAVFSLAEPFNATVAAEGLGKARFMSWSPDGRLFVPDLVDYKLAHTGKVYILEDFNEETRRFETRHTYLSGLRGANSVAFYTDTTGKHWLYVALTKNLIRYPYAPGDTAPSGEPEIIIEFPNTQTPGETSVVWHITRTLLFHNDRLYISIGSGCNSCEQLEGALRGMITSMNPDGSDVKVYADGLRNSVGIVWGKDSLYTTANGADHLGDDAPDELLYKINEGVHYGWPYCYETAGKLIADTSTDWDTSISCEEDIPPSLAAFPPRSAPLGLTYFGNDAHPALRNSFLVALHGSFDASLQRGYQIVRVTENGAQDVFMDGFQLPDTTRIARPVAFLHKDKNSFFFTDDHGGRIFYVYVK